MTLREPFNPEGVPAAEVLATGRPVVSRDTEGDRYPGMVITSFGCGKYRLCRHRSRVSFQTRSIGFSSGL